MKTVLITGGCGFIGSNFLVYFLGKYTGYRVINLDCLTYAGNLENLKAVEGNPNYLFVKGSVTDFEFCRKIFRDYEVDGVINFAAETHVDRSVLDSRIFVETNVVGTHTLLECARESGVKRFLQISTDEVYGSLVGEGVFREESLLSPNNPYSSSKAAAELLALSYHRTHRLPVMITRCSNNYGPYQFPEKLIPLMIMNCLKRKKLPLYGKGENVRDWIHVRDHVEAIDLVFHSGNEGEIYNVGAGNELKNLDLVKLLCQLVEKKTGLSGGELESLITFVKDRPGHDLHYAIDSTKLKKTLNWEAKIDFQTGLSSVVDWYLGNKEWLENVSSGQYQKYYEKHYVNREKTF